MELKNYFKKYGKGWILLGLVLSFLFISYGYFSSKKIWLGLILYFILVSFFFIFVPFVMGFFGLVRLFYVIVSWEVLFVGTNLLDVVLYPNAGERLPPYPLILLLPLVLIIGIIWEIIHHKKNIKKVS